MKQNRHKFLEEEPVCVIICKFSIIAKLIQIKLTLIPSMEPILMTDDVFSLDAFAVKRGRQLCRVC